MNIGTFALKNGQLIGSIATLTVDLARLGLRPVESTNDKAPAFEIMALNVARKWVQVGALWEATSNSTGEVFYQGSLDDPSLPEKMAIMVFGDDEDGYRVVWNRPAPMRQNMDGTRQTRRRQRDDNFGEGNATEDGRIAAENEEDHVPAF